MKKLGVLSIFVSFIICLAFSGTSVSAALKSGSVGSDVTKLQMNLNGLGYCKTESDGIYGTDTISAVKIFQSANGLSADGIAGDATLAKVNTIVSSLQTDLNNLGYNAGIADGIYGTATKNAVTSFQSANSLSPDGIAGYRTLQKISSAKSKTISGYSATESKIVTYSLASDGDSKISNHFKIKEFQCNDGTDTIKIDLKLVALLEDIREYFGKPVVISSAYRTSSYNKKVGGSTNSLHLYGQAADISISGIPPKKIAQYAESLGVKGIGLYSTFVHVDTRSVKYYWSYGKSTSTFK